MSTGLSIGWFDPKAIADNPGQFVLNETLELGRGRKSDAVISREVAQACYYTHVRANSEIAIKRHGFSNGAGPEWHFVMATANRPVLLMAKVTMENIPTIAVGGSDEDLAANKPNIHHFRAIELAPGMALHFDTTEFWHGYTQFPVPEVLGVPQDTPSAFIIRLGMYRPAVGDHGSMIGRAIDACRAIADRAPR